MPLHASQVIGLPGLHRIIAYPLFLTFLGQLIVPTSTIPELLVWSGSASQLDWFSHRTLHSSDDSVKAYQKPLRPQSRPKDERGVCACTPTPSQVSVFLEQVNFSHIVSSFLHLGDKDP